MADDIFERVAVEHGPRQAELWRTLDGENPAAVALHVLRLAATCTQDYRAGGASQ